MMSAYDSLFRDKKKSESVVLVDIGTDSIAGACVRYAGTELPAILYTRRLPVEAREDEPREKAVIRALRILTDTLIREGAPILVRTTGTGRIDAILASINGPWQTSSVRIEQFEQETPFIFTKSLVTKALERNTAPSSEKFLADESTVGTILNGYETHNPYGKKAHRASVIILTSLIDKLVAEGIRMALESAYHSKHILSIAGNSLRYQAMQKVFPHERNALILDAMGHSTSLALVRNGLLVSIIEIPGADTTDAWIESMGRELAELAKNYPLPRTIFLLARETEISSLRQTIDAAHLGKLWLSDNPPKIVSVLGNHMGGLVRHADAVSLDLSIILMAIYYQAIE